MKINQYSLINVVQSEDYINHHVQFQMKAITFHPQGESVYVNKINLHLETDYRKLVFSKKSLQNLENYIVPKDIRVDVLRILPNRKDIIQLDERNCIQYIKTDEQLSVIFHYTKQGEELIHMNYFEIDLVSGKIKSDDKLSGTDITMDREKLIEHFYSKFLVVVTYLELTEVTLNVLQGGGSYGTKKEGKIKNDTRNKYILVNTNWNVTTIRLDEFSVRGHFRLQPCGVGRKNYKYVYIEPYTKGGIKRLAQKKTVKEEMSI
jgi:hypothetical protein